MERCGYYSVKYLLDAGSPDIVDIASKAVRTALVGRTHWSLVSGIILPALACNFYKPLHLQSVSICSEVQRNKDILLMLLFAFNGVLQPKQVTVFTANFIRPPTVGVAIEIVRVWSPDTRGYR